MESKTKDQFYFQGKWLDSYEEFIDYASKWSNLPLDEESANRTLESIKKTIIFNVRIYDIKLTNGEFALLFDNAVMKVLQKIVNETYEREHNEQHGK